MTPKQREFIRLRGTGIQPKAAAIQAGYATKSAAVSASRLERRQDVIAAIQAAKDAAQTTAPLAEFQDAQGYLTAVVLGTTPPDPVRVSAARALLPFEKAKSRSPIASPPPAQLAKREELSAESAARDEWARRSAEVRARHAKATKEQNT